MVVATTEAIETNQATRRAKGAILVTTPTTRTMSLEVDELDYQAIQEAITVRQQRPREMPDGGGNRAGRVIADICRAFVDYRAAELGVREV